MNIYPGMARLPHFANGCALTIGNFDGVHLGHRKILQILKQKANEYNIPSILMVFEPHPREYFARINNAEMLYRLTPLRDKLRLLEKTGLIDGVVVLRFNQEFSLLSATDFVQKILLEKLNVKYLLVGDDFRFGSGRSGDFDFLSQHKELIVERMSSVEITGSRASSTSVRKALQLGNLNEVKNLLGEAYSLSGRVMHGKKLGRTIGCPTANIYLPHHRYPLNGVFVVDIAGDFGIKHGVANFGFNPTVSEEKRQYLEVHIFDFNQNIYGQRLEVAFLEKLRDEKKFSSIEELKYQINQDMMIAKQWHDKQRLQHG